MNKKKKHTTKKTQKKNKQGHDTRRHATSCSRCREMTDMKHTHINSRKDLFFQEARRNVARICHGLVFAKREHDASCLFFFCPSAQCDDTQMIRNCQVEFGFARVQPEGHGPTCPSSMQHSLLRDSDLPRIVFVSFVPRVRCVVASCVLWMLCCAFRLLCCQFVVDVNVMRRRTRGEEEKEQETGKRETRDDRIPTVFWKADPDLSCCKHVFPKRSR